MKILFIDNYSINFGIAQLSAILKEAGHVVELLTYKMSKWKGIDLYHTPDKYFNFHKISDVALAKSPDVIGFSVCSPNFMFYKHASHAIRKKSNIPIIVGGAQPTLSPDFILNNSYCDIVFRGEAEPLIDELVQRISNGTYQKVSNIVYRDDNGKNVHNPMDSFVEDLNSLPFYDDDLYPDKSNRYCTITSRGCVMKCSYCSAGAYSQMLVRPGVRAVRKRSVDSVIEEIKRVMEKRKLKEIAFYDDFFITTRKWLAEFTEKYKKEIDLPYWCGAFPAMITRDVAALLAESRCNYISIGFQTANDEYKKNILRRNETKKQVLLAMKNMDEFGIKYVLDHIFGLPGETREHIKESLDFYIDNKVKSVTIYFLNYYPDSYFVKYAYENAFITQEVRDKIMRNELIGEQSFKGSIVDKKKANEQVKYTLLFRLISWLPGNWVKWIFDNNLQKFFPTWKYFYYAFSVITLLKLIGFDQLFVVLKISHYSKKKIIQSICAFGRGRD